MEFKFWVLVSLGLLGREAVPAAVANPLLLNRKLLFATDCAGITFSPETEAEAAAAAAKSGRKRRKWNILVQHSSIYHSSIKETRLGNC